MGWTSYHLNGELKDGKYIINIKSECDRLLTQKAHESHGVWYKEMTVLKSSMVGRTYYAAVKTTDRDGNYHIWAAVFLTSTDQRNYNNFAYKDMDETCGPMQCKCPKGILNLLTDTDSEYAKKWREQCWAYHESKKSPNSLENLPIGSKITFINQYTLSNGTKPGDTIVLTKVKKPGKKRERKYWTDGIYRWGSGLIPKDFKVIA